MSKTGKTTRIVDRAIQEFFEKGVAYIYDGRDKKENTHMGAMRIFLSRMETEHKNSKFTYEYACFDNVWCYKIEKHNL